MNKVKLPSSVTKVGKAAYEYCSGVKSIILSAKMTEIPDELFADCTSLKSAVIPKKVTKIGEDAFYNCSSLTYVAIPLSVLYYGSEAFDECPKLKDLYYVGTAKQFNTNMAKAASKRSDEDTIELLKKLNKHYQATGPTKSTLTLTASKLTMTKGSSKKLTYKLAGNKLCLNVTFTSSNKKVCTVGLTTGTIKAKASGTAVITVKTDSGLVKKCTVTVK